MVQFGVRLRTGFGLALRKIKNKIGRESGRPSHLPTVRVRGTSSDNSMATSRKFFWARTEAKVVTHVANYK